MLPTAWPDFFVHVAWLVLSPGFTPLALVELVLSVGRVVFLSNFPARLFILILGMHLIFIARDTQVNVGGNKRGVRGERTKAFQMF